MTIGAERPPYGHAPQEVLAVERPLLDEAGLARDAVAVRSPQLRPVAHRHASGTLRRQRSTTGRRAAASARGDFFSMMKESSERLLEYADRPLQCLPRKGSPVVPGPVPALWLIMAPMLHCDRRVAAASGLILSLVTPAAQAQPSRPSRPAGPDLQGADRHRHRAEGAGGRADAAGERHRGSAERRSRTPGSPSSARRRSTRRTPTSPISRRGS